MNLQAVRRDDWILFGAALLLAIDLLAFSWLSFGIGPFSLDLTGTDVPDGWTAVIAVIALFALIADLALERLAPETTLPMIGGSRTMTRFVLAVVAAFFIFLKFVLNIHFGNFGYGFWLAIPLTVALVYFAMEARNATSVPPARPPVGSPGPPPA